MNKIVFVGNNASGERENKYLEIIIGDEKATIVPPYCGYREAGEDLLRVYIEQPITPIKEVVRLSGNITSIWLAAVQAQEILRWKKGEAILQALGNLLVSLVTYYADRNEFSPLVEMVRGNIEENISDPFYVLEDYIKKLPLSYDYVRKLFKKETGLTPRVYLENARMELAANILSCGLTNKYSNYSVAQVAEACGYAEPLYFSRVFKKHFGVAPKEYKA